MTVSVLLILGGLLFFALGTIGGGISFKEMRMPELNRWARVVLSTVGTAVFFLGLWTCNIIRPIHHQEVSTTCKFNKGPKAGKIQYFSPDDPGTSPGYVDRGCHDGLESTGVAVPDGTPTDD